MDGTLLDSKKDITISVNYVRKTNHNLPPLSEEFVVEAINMEGRNLAKLFYNTELYEDRDRVIFEEYYAKQCTKNVYLYDGIKEMLNELKNSGIKLSVATNAPTIFAKIMLSRLDVAHMFDVIIGADKVSASKPSPDMINYILNYYNYDKDNDKAWMVGDNTKDVHSAQKAGIEAIFVTWGFSSESTYKNIIKTPKDLLSIVL